MGAGPTPAGRLPVRFLLRSADAPGGVVRTVLNLAEHLSETHDVEVISLFHRRRAAHSPPPDAKMTYLEDRTLGHGTVLGSPLLARHTLAATPSALINPADRMYPSCSMWTDVLLARTLRSMAPGVLVTTRPTLHVVAARLAPADVVVVAQEHLNFETRPADLLDDVNGCAEGIDALVVLTERDRRDVEASVDTSGPGARPVVAAIPNAVPGVRDGLAHETTQPRDRVIVAAGRLMRQKGFDLLIRAFEPLAAAHPGWRVEIYGDGPERDRLLAMIGARRLQGRVSLMGFSDRLPERLASASIFALSSRFEGLPMVGIESLAAGLPIVAFDCPRGPRELVDDGENGLLAPDGDLGAFTAALAALMADDARRSEMGAAARHSALAYDMGLVGARWKRLFCDLADRADRRVTRRRRVRWRRLGVDALKALRRRAARMKAAHRARQPYGRLSRGRSRRS
jgi:glycosyltransferase involved in cell wall biosynthesis